MIKLRTKEDALYLEQKALCRLACVNYPYIWIKLPSNLYHAISNLPPAVHYLITICTISILI